MSNETIQELVAKLRQELKVTPVEEDTRVLMQQLETEIEDLLDPDVESNNAEPVVENARELQARFASEYPRAERFVREIIDMLGKMGV